MSVKLSGAGATARRGKTAIRRALGAGILGLLCGAALSSSPAQALTVNAVFTDTYQGPFFNPADVVNPQGDPAVAGAIDAAASQIASQFNNNVTVNILFEGVHAGTNSFLAASTAGQMVYTYGQYTGALSADAAAHPSNKILNTAVANLGSGNGANDPNALVGPTTADARALGLNLGLNGDSTPEFDANGMYLGGGGTVDGIVFLNLDQPLSYSRPIQPVSAGVVYDAQTSLEHEIDEVLGIGGQGSMLNAFNQDPNYAHDDYGVSGDLFGALDLYRYQAPGLPSFDPATVSITGCTPALIPACSGLPSPYFSVDGGATFIDSFNQAFALASSDAGDWGLNLFRLCPGLAGVGGTGDVQDAFSCNNHSADVRKGAPAYKAFLSVGYNGVAVPEPATWAIMLAGVGGLGAGLRRRREAAA